MQPNIMKAKKKKVETLKPEDLGLDFVSCCFDIADDPSHLGWRSSVCPNLQSVLEAAR
jgi:electron transfer flavoprotein alpha/beta subunit